MVACGCATPSPGDPSPASLGKRAWDDVQSRIRRGKAGGVIELPPREWRDRTISFDAAGTPERPITLRAARAGKTIFLGRSSISIQGKHLMVAGVVFTGETNTKSSPIVFTPASRDCRL